MCAPRRCAALFCRRCYVYDCKLHGATVAVPRVRPLPHVSAPCVPHPTNSCPCPQQLLLSKALYHEEHAPRSLAGMSLPVPAPEAEDTGVAAPPFLLRRLHTLYRANAAAVAGVLKVSTQQARGSVCTR